MNRLLKTALVVGAVALVGLPFLFAPPKPVNAAQSVLCSPEVPGGTVARTIGSNLPTSPVPSGTVYTLNGQGCAVVLQADIGYFLSQGFTAGPPFGPNILFTTGVWTGTTSFQAGVLPPGTYIQHIIMQETAGNAVTGGVKVGTTSGGADVVAALTVSASSLAFVADSALLKRVFSATAQQALFITPATAGNNANVTVTVVFGYF